MTTIAYKDGLMAADTQLTDFSFVTRVQKIYELPDGSLVGGCGTWYQANRAIQWLLKGRRGKAPKLNDCQLMIVKPDHSIWLAEGRFPEYKLEQSTMAIGCGAQAAMVALNAGASAVDAIRQTIKVDCMTSEPIQVLALPQKPKRKRR